MGGAEKKGTSFPPRTRQKKGKRFVKRPRAKRFDRPPHNNDNYSDHPALPRPVARIGNGKIKTRKSVASQC